MFSVNPAYDLEQGDELGVGSTSERAALLRRCEAMGVGVSVMKPFSEINNSYLETGAGCFSNSAFSIPANSSM